MEIVCQSCKRLSMDCENCMKMQHHCRTVRFCSTCHGSTYNCEMCKILREVDYHLREQKQQEQRQQQEEDHHKCIIVSQEEAERNKRDITIALGLVVLCIGQIGYVIGKTIECAIERWQNEDDDEDES